MRRVAAVDVGLSAPRLEHISLWMRDWVYSGKVMPYVLKRL